MKNSDQSITRRLLTVACLAFSGLAVAADNEPVTVSSATLTTDQVQMQLEASGEEALAPVPLAELVNNSDLVALIRVLDTDYEHIREFPSGGTAFLEIMIPYKVSRPDEDIIKVYEEGLHAGECYFRNPTVLEEGRRHLVFLKFSPQVADQYNGLKAGCALDVLVTEDNSYALRYPLAGVPISDDLSAHAIPIEFRDAYAWVEEEDISPPLRDELLASGYLVKEGLRYRYTSGIPLSKFRQLMGPNGLTLDRTLK